MIVNEMTEEMMEEIMENPAPGFRRGIFLRTALFWCLLVGVFFALVSVAPLFPRGRLDEHLKSASPLLGKEGLWWTPFGQMPPIYNFADALMLNVAGTLDAENPVRSAMRMDMAYAPEDGSALIEPLRALQNLVEGKATAKEPYSRYWHGHTVFFRPLLSVMSFQDVRTLSCLLSMMLFSAAALLLARRESWQTALAFAAVMTLGGFPVSALCISYAFDFLIALVIMCAILYWNIRDEESLVRLLLLSGALCSFLDLLTVPVVTLMLPLLAWLLPELKRQPRWDWRRVREIFLLCAVWSAGYVFTWAAKWVLADAVLGEGSVSNALNQILLRTGSTAGMTFLDRIIAIVKNIYPVLPLSTVFIGSKGMTEIIPTVIYRISNTAGLTWFEKLSLMTRELFSLLPSSVYLSLAAALCVLAVYLGILISLALRGGKRKPLGALGYFSLAFLFLIPYFWYFVTANHATIHFWFTFRNQISSVWLLLILPHLIKNESGEGTPAES
jgi:hypothetical protein